MRARHILAAALCVVLYGTAAYAAASAETAETPEVNWTVVIASLAVLTTAGQRLARWVVDNWRLISFVFRLLEELRAKGGEPEASSRDKFVGSAADEIISRLKAESERRGGAFKDLTDKAAAGAEKGVGKNGGATERRRSRGRLAREISRWLPAIGLLP